MTVAPHLTGTMTARWLKIAAAPYRPPTPLPADPEQTRLVAQRAEEHLRRLLFAGIVPDVELVAIERATPAVIGPGGVVQDVWAWDIQRAGEPEFEAFQDRFTAGGAYVIATLEGCDAVPDPASEEYAAAGSVLVRRGRVTRLRVASWLKPVAQRLADRYGVAVSVARANHPPYLVQPAPPVVVPAAIDRAAAASLRAWFDDHLDDPELRVDPDARVNARGARYVLTPPPIRAKLLDIVEAAGARLGLPVSAARSLVIARYPVGASHPWHADLDRTRPSTWDRTVSCSLILSEPGVQFSGGTFRTEYGPVDVQLGDLIAFTAETRHAVDPVTDGARYVLIAFGSYDGWT